MILHIRNKMHFERPLKNQQTSISSLSNINSTSSL